MKLILKPTFSALLRPTQPRFDYFLGIEGQTFRRTKDRETLRFTLGSRAFFIKKHFGVSWGEIFKNLLCFRMPIFGAKNEWLALQKCENCHIPTIQWVGYGEQGFTLATKRSFLITQEADHTIGLKDICDQWHQTPPTFAFKQAILVELATLAKRFHACGINHRDFYICHFLLDRNDYQIGKVKLYIFDLHRAQIRSSVPKRWLIKDLAGLWFSAMGYGFTQRDLLRFIQIYFDCPWRQVLKTKRPLLLVIQQKALQLYKKYGNLGEPI